MTWLQKEMVGPNVRVCAGYVGVEGRAGQCGAPEDGLGLVLGSVLDVGVLLLVAVAVMLVCFRPTTKGHTR